MILRLSLMAFFTLFVGCAAPFDVEIGSTRTSIYQAPSDYAAHRSQQQLFTTADGQIAYTDHGASDRRTFVFLHGVPTSSWMYRKVIPDLQQHVRVITVDLLGYGSSDKPEDDGEIYTPVAQAARVTALLDKLGVARYGIVMHDMGGLVAWEMLRSDVTRVDHLVVLNTIIQAEGFNHPSFKPGMLTRQMARAMSSQLTSAAALELTFRSLGLTGDSALTEAECFGYVQPMREGASPALYAFYASLNQSLYDRLQSNQTTFARYTGRTLILWGAKDDILTTSQLPFLQQHLKVPAEQIHVYPDQQHFLAEEIPEEIVRKIVAFL